MQRYTPDASVATILINNFKVGQRGGVSFAALQLCSFAPFKFRRRQFPLRPAFAMTINKAQGQTLRMAGLYLLSQPFSHGQLYVAKTRVGSRNALRMVVKCGKARGREGVCVLNVVHKELLLR